MVSSGDMEAVVQALDAIVGEMFSEDEIPVADSVCQYSETTAYLQTLNVASNLSTLAVRSDNLERSSSMDMVKMTMSSTLA